MEKTKEGKVGREGGRGLFVVSTEAIKRVTAKMTRSNGYCTFLATVVFV